MDERRAMILAAGRGERMRPLSDHTPKPLLAVGGKALIDYHLERLAHAHVGTVVINLCHLGDRIRAHVGDGERFGVQVVYSEEQPEALETGGGIRRALPLLGRSPFIAVNGDVWCDFSLERLRLAEDDWAQLVLVDNPPHHAQGDFYLQGDRVADTGAGTRLTFAGIGLYRPCMFDACPEGRFPLAPLLRTAMEAGRVSGCHYTGEWDDVGTPQRLQRLNGRLHAPRASV